MELIDALKMCQVGTCSHLADESLEAVNLAVQALLPASPRAEPLATNAPWGGSTRLTDCGVIKMLGRNSWAASVGLRAPGMEWA